MQQHEEGKELRSQVEEIQGHQHLPATSARSIHNSGLFRSTSVEEEDEEGGKKFQESNYVDTTAQSTSAQQQKKIDDDLPTHKVLFVGRGATSETRKERDKRKEEQINVALHDSSSTKLAFANEELTSANNNNKEISFRGNSSDTSMLSDNNAHERHHAEQEFVIDNSNMNESNEDQQDKARIPSPLCLQANEEIREMEKHPQLQHTTNDTVSDPQDQQMVIAAQSSGSFPMNSGRLANPAAENLAIQQRFVGQQQLGSNVSSGRNKQLCQQNDEEGGSGSFSEKHKVDFSVHISADLVGDTAPVTEEEIRAKIFRESAQAEIVQPEVPKQAEPSNLNNFARKHWSILTLICLAIVGAIVVVAVFVLGSDDGDDTLPESIPRDVFITTPPSLTPTFQLSTSRPTLQPWTYEMQIRYEFFNELVWPISGNALDLPDSPQSQAFQWLILEDDCVLFAINSTDSVFLKERYVLAVLYFATNGPQWSADRGFLSKEHHCSWGIQSQYGYEGVGCRNGFVSDLVLSNNNLEGMLPPELSSLTALTYLDFFLNRLYGTIPRTLAQLPLLSDIAFDFNDLSGTLPSIFFEMKSLRQLWLDDNVLTGRLPENIGSATALTSLTMVNNLLTGSIPAGLSTLKRLLDLSLSENLFVGQWPSFAESHALIQLQLGGSQLSGSIPTTIGNCKNLEFIHFYDMSLNSSVPTEMTALPKLVLVQITNADLSGTIPIFVSTNMEYILFQRNRLRGGLDDFLTQATTSLLGFNLEDNLLGGSIPKAIGNYTSLNNIILSGNDLTGTIGTEVGLLTTLDYLDVAGNKLTGTIPTELGQLSAVRDLYMSDNHLEGQLPSELGNMSSLQAFTVFTNSLTGTISTSIAEMKTLNYLQVYNNSFNGSLSAFCNRTETVDIAADCSELSCDCCAICCNQQGVCKPNAFI